MLAQFLVSLACKKDQDGNGTPIDYTLGCALLTRLQRTLKDDPPERPLRVYLAEGLLAADCAGIPKWEGATKLALECLKTGDGTIRSVPPGQCVFRGEARRQGR